EIHPTREPYRLASALTVVFFGRSSGTVSSGVNHKPHFAFQLPGLFPVYRISHREFFDREVSLVGFKLSQEVGEGAQLRVEVEAKRKFHISGMLLNLFGFDAHDLEAGFTR